MQRRLLRSSCLCTEIAVEASASVAAKDDAAYYGHYAKALEKAIAKNCLPAAVKQPLLHERRSQKDMELRSQGPWVRAQADVYALIGEHMAKQEGCEEQCVTVL